VTTTNETSLTAKHSALRRILESYDSVLVAFSGGVDSSFLLYVAAKTLDTRCVALTTESPTNSPDELAEARAFASALGVRHVVRRTNELEVPGYAANPPNRCYLCKQTLYPVCFEEADRIGLKHVVDGVNRDDLSDYRPGLRAAAELGVSHPLVDAELGKTEIRELSRLHGLRTAERPASPCLSSRFPYGTRITRERLQQVAQAEAGVRRLGFVELRVRHLGESARVELSAAEISRIADSALRQEIEETVKRAGFATVEVSDQPLRSGSLNDALRR
jgi:uncharacterized protein